MWETICQFALLVPLVAIYSIRYYYNYWQRKKIPCVGSSCLDFEWYSKPATQHYAEIYRQLDGHKFGGFYEWFGRKLMVRDPELIRRILVDDFECFHDRGGVTFDENDLTTMHTFSARGVFWKNLRTNLTPAFSSNKIKSMFGLIEECAKELIESIENEIKIEDMIDVKDLTSSYTIDVISSCAIGLKTRVNGERRSSAFKSMASKLTCTRSLFPRMEKLLGLRASNKAASEFFFELIEERIRHRESNGADVNSDFLRSLMDARSRKEASEFVMTDDLLNAQCLLFFMAGYDSTLMTLNGALYELAANPHVQIRLQDEIDEYLNKHDDKIDHEMVENIPYLHRVFSETLRKHPALAVLSRISAENYSIANTEVIIEKGTEVLIPVSGLHSDSQYFPSPEKFDPDRFVDLGKHLPCPGAYLPYGEGPRNCMGLKFSSLCIKLALVYLLRYFRFELCSKTRYPFEYELVKIACSVKHDIFLRCCKRLRLAGNA